MRFSNIHLGLFDSLVTLSGLTLLNEGKKIQSPISKMVPTKSAWSNARLLFFRMQDDIFLEYTLGCSLGEAGYIAFPFSSSFTNDRIKKVSFSFYMTFNCKWQIHLISNFVCFNQI